MNAMELCAMTIARETLRAYIENEELAVTVEPIIQEALGLEFDDYKSEQAAVNAFYWISGRLNAE